MALLRRRKEERHDDDIVLDPTGELPALTSTPMADAVARRRVCVIGNVTRMRTVPADGLPSLSVTLSDGTGSVVAVWSGRRAIGGIALGQRIALDGVAVQRGNLLEFTNPVYQLLPPNHSH